jgi:hypothetical protein
MLDYCCYNSNILLMLAAHNYASVWVRAQQTGFDAKTGIND